LFFKTKEKFKEKNFCFQFITPIVKVSKGNKQEKSFYSMPEFEEWQQNTDNWNTWKIKFLNTFFST